MDHPRVLLEPGQIARRIRALAAEVAAEPPPADAGDLVMLVVLKGAFVFAADLARALDGEGLAPAVDFLSLASYGEGTESSGEVRLRAAPALDLRGRDVLLVDDIVDTGRSLAWARRWLEGQGPARVRACVLLDKPSRRVVPVAVEHVGFEVPDAFVVGYGIDWAERWRHLPYVGTM